MLPELVKQKIEENKSAMLDTLQTLISIPSVATAEPENRNTLWHKLCQSTGLYAANCGIIWTAPNQF